MVINCPKCGRRVEGANLNAAKDLATCGSCGEAFVLSDLLARSSTARGERLETPPGAWFRLTPAGWETGATTRSWMALFLIPFLVFWTAGFSWGFFGHDAKHAPGAPPLPAFMAFFFAVAAMFWWFALMSVAGRVSVRKEGDAATVFVGIGSLGWRKTVTWSSINAIREEPSYMRYPGGQGARLCLDGPRRVAFGSMLTGDRRYFLMRTLQEQLTS